MIIVLNSLESCRKFQRENVLHYRMSEDLSGKSLRSKRGRKETKLSKGMQDTRCFERGEQLNALEVKL